MKFSLIGSDAHAALEARTRREERSLASMSEIDPHERMRDAAEMMTTRGMIRRLEQSAAYRELTDPHHGERQRAAADELFRSGSMSQAMAVAQDPNALLAELARKSSFAEALGMIAPQPEPLTFAFVERPLPPPPRVVVIYDAPPPRRR